MSRFWATCFGGSEDQSNSHRRRGRRRNDSETDSSYDSDDESESDEGPNRFNRVERGEAKVRASRREEDIRLEEVLTAEDYPPDAGRGGRMISVVDSGPPPGNPPVVSRFVEHVLRASQKGFLQRPPQSTAPSDRRDVLPQVSMLHEASKVYPDALFVRPDKGRRPEERLSSGGSISSSGSSRAESGRSSTSSGIGDSFTSGNDTGGSGQNRYRRSGPQTVDRNRGKSNTPFKSKSDWSQGVLQDVLVEEEEAASGHMSHFIVGRGTERQSVATVEGVHLPSHIRNWGTTRLFNSESPSQTSSKIGHPFSRNRIVHHPNMIRIEDHPRPNGTSKSLNKLLETTVGNFKGKNLQLPYYSSLPKNSRNDPFSRSSVIKY